MSNVTVKTQRYGVLNDFGPLTMYIDSCTFDSFYPTTVF